MSSSGLGASPLAQKNMFRPQGYSVNAYSLLLGTLVINILSLALPVMTLQVYDRILPNPGTGTLPVLIAGVCLAVFLEALLRLCRAYMIGRAGAVYEHRMSCDMMRHVLNADMSRMEGYGVGEFLHRMASVSKLKDFYNGYALTVVLEMLFVPVFMVLTWYIAGMLTVVPVAVLVIFTVMSLWYGYRLRDALHAREQADDKRFDFLVEALEGVHNIKSFALESYFQRRYESYEERSCNESYNVTREMAGTYNIGSVFSHIMVAAVIGIGAVMVLNGQLTTGALIATLLLSGRMMQPVQKLLSLWARYQDFALSKRHVKGILQTPQRQHAERTRAYAPAPDGRMDVENLSFKYGDSDAPVLKNVNLNITRGDIIYLSGSHGAGKTTLLKLMAGIYSATDGKVLVDGEPVESYETGVLPYHVGYIRSASLIFRGTIRDNITSFGQVDEAQAKEVAMLLNVDKDVARLSGGFDTFLSGSYTDSIPPGLRQRISMVRVLAAKPRLLLFDNADATLDKEGYAMVYSLLARLKGKVSMVVVSGDRNIRALANRALVLEDGTLREVETEFSQGNVRPYKELRL